MARKKTPTQLGALSREDHLVAKLVALEEFLDSSDARRNGASYVAAVRLSTQLRAEIDALQHPASVAPADPTAGLTDAQVINALADALRALPIHVLDDVLEAVDAERIAREAPALKVIDGGSS